MNLQGVLNLLFPHRCAVCNGTATSALCDTCRGTIRLHPPEIRCCKLCGKVLMEEPATGSTPARCPACIEHPPAFDLARSAAEFSGAVRHMIHDLKYRNGLWTRPELAQILEGGFRAYYQQEWVDIILPVPLNPIKHRSRSYNQSECLAFDLSRRLHLPMMTQLLVRTRNTPTQTHLDAAHRRANVSHAFFSPPALRPWVYGRTLLLIDDVMTTGSTLSECARALKTNGTERVITLTLARD